jgi:signal transduction histidine kinase
LAEELRPAIVINHQMPSLEKWSETSHKVPFKFSQTIELYDEHGNLLEHYGPPGVHVLSLFKQELGDSGYRARNFATPLYEGHTLIGFLQIQLSTRSRERAVNQFGATMGILAPLLLLALGLAGYLFAGKAAQPVEESFGVLQRFMSDAGHELSTPISIIQANAEAMEVEGEPNEAIQNRLNIIFRSTDRMVNLVRDLMLLSKMESPRLSDGSNAVDLSKLVESVVEEFQELFKNKSITLTAEKMAPCQITGDAESIKRLVTNLLQNALRYTDEGGKVEVSLENLGRAVKLAVKDSGVGIPGDSLPLIFDRFYRVDKSRSRAQGGSGLGLSIVKAIVESHKGKIEVQSEIGKGTIFEVILPMRV